MQSKHKRDGGHEFNRETFACMKCGMAEEHYQDNGKPRCTGKRVLRSDEPARDTPVGSSVATRCTSFRPTGEML